MVGVGAQQWRHCLAGERRQELGIDANLPRDLGDVVLVLNECFAEQSLRIQKTARRRADKSVQSRAEVRIVALRQNVRQPAEQVSSEVNVDVRGLVVQQRDALAHPRRQVLARQRERVSFGRARRRQARADQPRLKLERLDEIRLGLLQGRRAAIEKQRQVLRGEHGLRL